MLSRISVRALRIIVTCALVSLGFASLSPAALADGLTSTTNVNSGGSYLCLNTNSSTPLSKSACMGNWSATVGYPTVVLSGAGAAQSYAQYGLLGAAATASASSAVIGGAEYGTQSAGQASWDDTLSFAGLNQFETLQAVISLAGTSVANCLPGAAICGSSTVDYSANFDEGGGPIINCEIVSVGTCTMSLAVNGQSVVDFAGFLGVNTGVVITGVGPGSATTSVSYYDTAMVDSLTIVDANGNPVQGVDIVSASGTNYNSITEAPIPTPEASSLRLLGFGLIGLLGLSLRKAAA
jgi:hypothetical protein